MEGLGPQKSKAMPSTQRFLEVEEIKEGVVTLKNTSLRSVIMVSSANFALKSEEERDSIIIAYQNFLNSLNFPIQILARSRQLQLEEYLGFIKKIANEQKNELLKLQTEQYYQFIDGLLEEANIMEKRFFVVVPFYPIGVEKVGLVKKILSNKKTSIPLDFETQKMELMQRVQLVVGGLSSVGLRCAVLNTEDLIELFYTVYNPDTATSERLSNTDQLESPVITEGDDNV
jgi:hypothetical protein